MHGLWPDNCDGTQGPSNGCDTTRNYDGLGSILQQGDAELYADMNTYWPSYKGNAAAFWQVAYLFH
jgi:ribonuclease T2